MTVEDGYLMEDYTDENFDETGEVLTRKVGTEKITKADEETKREHDALLEKCERGEMDNEIENAKKKEKGIEEFDSLNDFYEYNNERGWIDIIYNQLEKYKTDETLLTGWRIRELNKMGYRLKRN